MPTLTLTLPRPHSGQARIIAEAGRFNVVACGRRFGKSALGVDRAIPVALAGRPVGWFSPTYKMLQEVWRDLTRLLLPVTRHVSAQDHRLQLVTGGTLEMWSLDVPNVARGRRYARLVVDEAAMVPDLLDTWHAILRPTLADYAGDAWFLSTPRGLNGFHDLYQRGQDPAAPEWASWQLPTSANPFIPASEIAAMQADLPALIFSQEVLAQFINLEGGLFRREWFPVLPARPADVARAVRFWDLAVSVKQTADFTAGGWLGQRAAGSLVLDDVIHGRWEWPDARRLITQTALRDGPGVPVGVEAVAFQMAGVQELRRDPALLAHTIVPSTPDKDKYARAMPWATRAQTGLFALVEGAWVSGFLNEVGDFPNGAHDDRVDMVSGGVQMLSRTVQAWA